MVFSILSSPSFLTYILTVFSAPFFIVMSHSLGKLLPNQTPYSFTLLRFVLTGIISIVAILLFLPRKTKIFQNNTYSWILIVVASVFFVLGTAIQIYGFENFGVSSANIPIACLTIIYSTLIGWLYFKESIRFSIRVGIVLQLMGTLLFLY